MSRFRILPYKQGSRSAKALADALGGKVLRLQGSTFKPKADDVLINWGNGSPFGPPSFECFNWFGLSQCTDKLKFFNKMAAGGETGAGLKDILPPFWTNSEDIPDEAFPVVCRTVLSGHSGAGIVIARTPEEVVPAQLYTGYIKKKDEYRVHCGKRQWVPHNDYTGEPMPIGVFRDNPHEVISLQRKARRLDCETPNWEVRNHSNGFVYVRDQVVPPASVIDVATKAFEASGLDFGAVDVIYNDKKQKAYVLEINTAPGLEGQTVTDYANFFKETTNG